MDSHQPISPEKLIEKLKTVNITTKQARYNIDVLIVNTAIKESGHQVFRHYGRRSVSSLNRACSITAKNVLKNIGKGNVETQMYSFKSFNKKYPRSEIHILFLHVFSGGKTMYL